MKLSWFGEVSHGNKESITSEFPLNVLIVTKLVIFKPNAGDPRLPFPLSRECGSERHGRWCQPPIYQCPPSGIVTVKIICRVKPPLHLVVGIQT